LAHGSRGSEGLSPLAPPPPVPVLAAAARAMEGRQSDEAEEVRHAAELADPPGPPEGARVHTRMQLLLVRMNVPSSLVPESLKKLWMMRTRRRSYKPAWPKQAASDDTESEDGAARSLPVPEPLDGHDDRPAGDLKEDAGARPDVGLAVADDGFVLNSAHRASLAVVCAMLAWPEWPRLQCVACRALLRMAHLGQGGRAAVAHAGGVARATAAMQDNPDNAEVLMAAAELLGEVAAGGARYRQLVSQSGALEQLACAMHRHLDGAWLNRAASAALEVGSGAGEEAKGCSERFLRALAKV